MAHPPLPLHPPYRSPGSSRGFLPPPCSSKPAAEPQDMWETWRQSFIVITRCFPAANMSPATEGPQSCSSQHRRGDSPAESCSRHDSVG